MPLIPLNQISCDEFITRLRNAVDYYAEYCRVIGAHNNREQPVLWIDHFNEFLDVEALEKPKKKA